MGNIWSWLFYSLPWQVQIGALLIVALVILYLLVRVFGWDRVKPYVIPVLGLIGAAGLLSRAQQKGFADRKAQEDAAAQKAGIVVAAQQKKAQDDTDDELKAEADKWSK